MPLEDDATKSLVDPVGSTPADADGSAPPRPDPARSAEGPAAAPSSRYRILAKLGEGGMGVVWKAEDLKLGRIVALKKIKGDSADGGVNLKRFLREAQLAARLQHPGIVGVYDCGEMDGGCFIAMEYIEGRTFSEYLRATQPAKAAGLRPGMARLREEIGHLAEVSEAVAQAHRQGIVHRDLKPVNIILDSADHPRVMDFGLAKEVALEEGKGFRDLRDALTVQGAVLGTPAYMSPEQADGRAAEIGPVSDVWALGVILYEILTGRRPFTGKSLIDTLAAILAEDPVPPRNRSPQAPAELEAVCLRALEKNTQRRYPSAGVFAAELRAWLAGEPVAARPLGGAARAWRSAKRNRAATISTLAVVAVTIALTWSGFAEWAATRRVRQVQDQIGASVYDLQTTLMTMEIPADARGALARQPLKVLDALLAADPAFGPAYSWRGRVYSMIGRMEEAEAEFDRGCRHSPGSAVVWYLRGMYAIQRYAESRGLPAAIMGADRVTIDTLPPESAVQTEWRTRGLADLERMATVAETDASFGRAELALGKATAAMHGDREDACAAALECLHGVDRPEAWRIQAFCLYVLGRFEDAVAAGTRAVEAWPADPRSRARRGYARLALGLKIAQRGEDAREELRRAESDLDHVITLENGLGDPYAFRSWIRWYRADLERKAGGDPRPIFRSALEDAQKALALQPDRVDSWVVLANAEHGFALAEQRSANDAREWFLRASANFERAARANPGSKGIQSAWARALENLAKEERRHGADPRATAEAALQVFGAALEKEPENADHWLRRGGLRLWIAHVLEARDLPAREIRQQALTDLTEAVRLDPDRRDARLERGIALINLAGAAGMDEARITEFYRTARADFDRVLDKTPGDGEVAATRGLLHVQVGIRESRQGRDPSESFRRAHADIDRAIVSGCATSAVWTNRALLWLAQGKHLETLNRDPNEDFSRAVADAGKAIELEPDLERPHSIRGDAWYALALSMHRRGTDPREPMAQAAMAYEAAIRLGNRKVDLPLGEVLANLGRFEESIASFTRGAERIPQSAAWVREQVEKLTVLKLDAEERRRARPWKDAMTDAQKLIHKEDYVRSRERFREGFDLWETQSAEEKQDQLARPSVRTLLSHSSYYYAAFLSMQAMGRDDGGEEQRDVSAGERARLLDLVFEYLNRSLELGWSDFELLRSEVAFQDWHDDPRWSALIRRGAK